MRRFRDEAMRTTEQEAGEEQDAERAAGGGELYVPRSPAPGGRCISNSCGGAAARAARPFHCCCQQEASRTLCGEE